MYSRHTKTKRLKFQALFFLNTLSLPNASSFSLPLNDTHLQNICNYPCKRLAIWP